MKVCFVFVFATHRNERIGAKFEQHADALRVVDVAARLVERAMRLNGAQKWRKAASVAEIEICGVVRANRFDELGEAARRREMKRRVARRSRVLRIWIGAGLEQKIDELVVILLDSEEKRRLVESIAPAKVRAHN